MIFYVIAKRVRGFFGKKDFSENFSAKDAAEARGIALKKFSKAESILLYQMLSPGETVPGNALAEYSRAWMWDSGKDWLRATAGRGMTLSEAPDNASDKDLIDKYLASLKS